MIPRQRIFLRLGSTGIQWRFERVQTSVQKTGRRDISSESDS